MRLIIVVPALERGVGFLEKLLAFDRLGVAVAESDVIAPVVALHRRCNHAFASAEVRTFFEVASVDVQKAPTVVTIVGF